ncbi:MAG: SufE family protein [Waddliaceae bacterium]
MYRTCLEKQEAIKALFSNCSTEEERYLKIIEIGRESIPLDPKYKVPENIVQGCQSTLYLRSHITDGVVMFHAESDALISSGLAALLIHVYNGETPETIIKCPPDFLEELNISASLTPNRANGLYSLHLRMKQDALKFLL